MNKVSNLSFFIGSFLSAVLFSSCTAGETSDGSFPGDKPAIALAIDAAGPLTRAPGDPTLSVDRLLILPFRKNDPAGNDDPANYVPVYEKAKQIDIGSFPVSTWLLDLASSQTYRLLAIGYNRNDYDFSDQANASRRFDIGSPAAPATLANLYLKPVDPTRVPEFFACQLAGYDHSTLIGTSFSPAQINNMKGTLKRIVGAFTLELDVLPASVVSVSLVAERLVTAVRAFDGAPLAWQAAGDTGNKLFGAQTPVAGRVVFNHYMLATTDARKTRFYLDIASGASTRRFTVNVADSAGVSSGSQLIFTPNQWVKITGKYADVQPGFVFSGSINLDDNAWDGLQ